MEAVVNTVYALPARAALTIPEFCSEHRISRTTFYEIAKAGKGPRLIKLGRRTLISGEAAADWRRDMERATSEVSHEAA